MNNIEKILLDHLMDLLEKEPPQDAGQHPSLELHERVGAAWAEWDKQVSSFRTILGAMLVNDAIQEARQARKEH